MLDALGLSAADEAVYRAMLEQSYLDVAGLARLLSVDVEQVHGALDRLVDLALVRVTGNGFRLVRPQAGLAGLLAKAEAELLVRQRQIDASRAAVAALATTYQTQGLEQYDEVVRLNGLEAVRDRLSELAHTSRRECLSFTPGGAQHPDTIAAEKPLNLVALRRGLRIRNLYLESFRKDPATVAHSQWMAEHGGQSRTVPTLPMRMVIVDRELALVPIDPDHTDAGALELRSPGIVGGLVNMFDQLWATGTPLAGAAVPGDTGLSPQEQALIRLLAQGHTDESAGRHLGISARSVQRLMTSLTTDRLRATSRFQAGVEATKRGWC